MKKKLNKQIKATLKAIANHGNAEEALLYSHTLINLMNAKQVAKNIKNYM